MTTNKICLLSCVPEILKSCKEVSDTDNESFFFYLLHQV